MTILALVHAGAADIAMLGRLNRRHKTALFFTLTAAGASLVAGAAAKQTAGIALLGLAFTWAFGSNSRVVHWLFIAVGVALLAGPIVYDWYSYRHAAQLYESEILSFERRIPELTKKYPFKKTATDPQTGARMGWNGAMWVVFSPGTSDHKIGDEWDGENWISEPDAPKGISDALQAGVDVDALPSFEKPSYFPPQPFSLRRALAERRLFEVPGLSLLGIGLGLLFGLNCAPFCAPSR